MSVSFCMCPCSKMHSVIAYLDTIKNTLVWCIFIPKVSCLLACLLTSTLSKWDESLHNSIFWLQWAQKIELYWCPKLMDPYILSASHNPDMINILLNAFWWQKKYITYETIKSRLRVISGCIMKVTGLYLQLVALWGCGLGDEFQNDGNGQLYTEIS